MSLVIGIDPDSDKHGFAVYTKSSGILQSLSKKSLMEIMDFFVNYKKTSSLDNIKFSIEDVMSNKFLYRRNTEDYYIEHSKTVQSKIAMDVGRCQQAQVELLRLLDHFKVKYVLHKPSKHNWANNERLFSMVTGWKSSSNQDTRSASYFGYLGL